MSDDIVKRLRDVGRDYDFHGNALIYEAADEIERLKNEKTNMIEATKKFVESAQKANDTIDDQWIEAQDKHLARIAALEEALGKIKLLTSWSKKKIDHRLPVVKEAHKLACDALKGGENDA